MPLKYQSGEEIRKGDGVLFHSDLETDWYVKEYGGGVMVFEMEPKNFGRVFLSDTENYEDLVLISRTGEASSGAKS